MNAEPLPAERHDLKILVKVARGGEYPHLATSRDISLSGLLLESPVPFALGQRIRVQLFLPRGRGALELAGEVAREAGETPSGHHYGVRFVEMAGEVEEELRRYLEGRQERATR